jgi:hypothetical protein
MITEIVKKSTKALSALTLILAASAAQAGVMNYNFSYTFDDFTSIAGMLDGTLGGDLDTITVNDVMATITSTGGTLGVDSFSFDTTTGGYYISGILDSYPGLLSLSGSLFELAVIGLPVSNGCTEAAGFCLIDTFASAAFPGPNANTYTLYPGAFEISAKTAVPVPATLALFGLGLAGLGWSRRKKA